MCSAPRSFLQTSPARAFALGLVLILGVVSPAFASPGSQTHPAVSMPWQFVPAPGTGEAFEVRGAGFAATLARGGVDLLLRGADERRLRLEIGASAAVDPAGEQRLPGVVNDLRGADPARWRTDVPTFARVRYQQVRPGVDIVFYGREGRLEYDVEIAPGADPAAIALRFGGADGIARTSDGALEIAAGARTLRQQPPIAYQEIDGVRHDVAVAYRIRRGEVTFDLGAYDRERPLVIDPVLVFSTLVGGSGFDQITHVTTDASGNLYAAGATQSPGLATPGAFDTTQGGSADAFVAKFDPTGRTLLYLTYLGGSAVDYAYSVATNAAGEAYVVGYTMSSNFPTTSGAYDRTCGTDGTCSRADGFVTKLNASGSGLVYSTYFGGSADDFVTDVGVDDVGRAHLVGYTYSVDLPITAGAYQSAYGGGFRSDGFHATLNGSGSGLAYSTYIGGGQEDVMSAIAVKGDGSRIIVGDVGGDGLTTVAPIQPAFGGGIRDAFIIAFGPTGTVQYATYYGGTSFEEALGVTFDGTGAPVIVGRTASTTLPGGFSRIGAGGNGDAFVLRLAADGQSIRSATLIGGSDSDQARAVAVDGSGRIQVAGSTSSVDFPTTADAWAPTAAFAASGFNGFYVMMNGTASSSTYSTYIPDAFVRGMTLGVSGRTFVGGSPGPTFPLVNPTRSVNQNDEGFIVRFDANALPPIGDPTKEIVLYASDADAFGAWRVTVDPTAAQGRALSDPDAGAPKLQAPLANPADYFELTFTAPANTAYRLWIRGRAERDFWGNDSVFVQFSDSVTSTGSPTWRIGTTSGTDVNLEDCLNCGLHGWGWQDNGWGAGVLGPLVRFASSGSHTIRVQTREDGFTIDQILLSAELYVTTSPGALKNDTTVLPESHGTIETTCEAGEVVLYAATASAIHGAWSIVDDTTAAAGKRMFNPDAGLPKPSTAFASPADYFDVTFYADAGVPYRLWMRGKAQNNYWGNDSVYVQFSDSVTGTGTPTWRIGTTSATSVIIEDCTGCVLSGWGWQDNQYGGTTLGTPVQFATSGLHTIRAQRREDGISIDQIVLSASKYFTTRPGAVRDDATILPACPTPPAR